MPNTPTNKTINIPINHMLVEVDEHTYLGLAVLADTVGESMEVISWRILQSFVESQLSSPTDDTPISTIN